MALPWAPFGAALFMLALLVLLRLYGKYLADQYREQFRNLVVGVGLFGLVAVLYLGEATGATAAVPFISQPPFLEVSAAILAITGAVLTASGASVWLPARRTGKILHDVPSEPLRREAEIVRAQLQDALALGAPLADSFTAIARVLKAALGGELSSLAMAYGEWDIRRYTAGGNGTHLTEKSLAGEAAGLPQENDSPPPDRPFVTVDFERFLEPALAAVLRRQQLAAALLVPLGDPGGAAMLVAAARSAEEFGERERYLAAQVRFPLRLAVAVERERDRLARGMKRSEALARLSAQAAARLGDIDRLFAEAADVLRRSTGAAAVRIALFEDDGQFLRSRAAAAAHPVENAVPATGYLIRSLMPLHQSVQATGEALLISQAEAAERMSAAEAQQIYQSDLSTALLSPITAGTETLGIIALADRRGSRRFGFTDDDRTFAAAVAAVLAQAVRLHETPWGALTWRDRESGEDADRRAELRGRIRSSLTGILGSVEMLRARPVGPEAERFVEIIDRSARRIETIFSEETPAR
ncbi:MAG TPA: GAF domain-containing protein [candidate division Zixibacteria bacterium]|nr:GAF domain-containing protein [candidate division Zixibacteria bacterium]